MANKLILLLGTLVLLSSFKNTNTEPLNFSPKVIIKKNKKKTEGLYLDSSFLSILGNVKKEDSLLKWSKKQYFNKFSYYHMGKILASEQKKALSDFIIKAKKSGINDHVAIMGGAPTFELIKEYNKNNSQESKFTSIQIEDEWWQNENTIKDYEDVIAILKKMKSWGQTQTPKVSVDLYFGRFNNITATAAEAADTLVKYTDRVLIAHQFDDPIKNFYPKYLKTRVKRFHEAAKRAKKEYPILIIFYPDQAPIYYTSNSYRSAFTNFGSRKWKNKIKPSDIITGYIVFAHTEAKNLSGSK